MGLGNYVTSEDAEVEGVWYEYEGFRVKMARASMRNTIYQEFVERHNANIKKIKSPKQYAEYSAKICSKTLIKDWETLQKNGEYKKGIEDIVNRTDKLLPVTEENLYKVLIKVPDLCEILFAEAKEKDAYLLDELEENAKNS